MAKKTPKTKTVKPPEWIQVGPVRYEIVHEELDARKNYHNNSDVESLGFFTQGDQKITIEPNQGETSKVDTLVHETLHAIYWQHGGGHILPHGKKHEEQYVWFFATALTDFLQRNPEWVNYVMSVNNDG